MMTIRNGNMSDTIVLELNRLADCLQRGGEAQPRGAALVAELKNEGQTDGNTMSSPLRILEHVLDKEPSI